MIVLLKRELERRWLADCKPLSTTPTASVRPATGDVQGVDHEALVRHQPLHL